MRKTLSEDIETPVFVSKGTDRAVIHIDIRFSGVVQAMVAYLLEFYNG